MPEVARWSREVCARCFWQLNELEEMFWDLRDMWRDLKSPDIRFDVRKSIAEHLPETVDVFASAVKDAGVCMRSETYSGFMGLLGRLKERVRVLAEACRRAGSPEALDETLKAFFSDIDSYVEALERAVHSAKSNFATHCLP